MERCRPLILLLAILWTSLPPGTAIGEQQGLEAVTEPRSAEKASLRPPIVIVENEVPLKIVSMNLDSRSGKATLTLENVSNRTIAAWALRKVPITDEGRDGFTGYSEDYDSGNVPGSAGISPGASIEREESFGRESQYVNTDIVAIHLVVPAVIFNDGSYVGSEEVAQRFFRTRGQRLLESERWLRVVEETLETVSQTEHPVPIMKRLVEKIQQEGRKTPGALQATALLIRDLELAIRQESEDPGTAYQFLEITTQTLRKSSEKLRRAVPLDVLEELKGNISSSNPDSLRHIGEGVSGGTCSVIDTRARSEENDCTFLGDGSGDHNISEDWSFACSHAPNTNSGRLDGFGRCCKKCGTTNQNLDCPPTMGPTSEDFATLEGEWGKFWQRSAIDKTFIVEGNIYKCATPGPTRQVDMFCPCPEDTEEEKKTECGSCTPIIIDLQGGGFRLTGLDDPVLFDIDADGTLDSISWTDPSSDEAFLALDRNGNGKIDDGRELFGAVTPQPSSADPNGFLALAELDGANLLGNGDGWISSEDPSFSSLLLWQDKNHDGISQPSELTSLALTEIRGIELSYVRSGRRDRHGNLVRWTSFVEFAKNKRRAAADVIFLRDE